MKCVIGPLTHSPKQINMKVYLVCELFQYYNQSLFQTLENRISQDEIKINSLEVRFILISHTQV